ELQADTIAAQLDYNFKQYRWAPETRPEQKEALPLSDRAWLDAATVGMLATFALFAICDGGGQQERRHPRSNVRILNIVAQIRNGYFLAKLPELGTFRETNDAVC